MPNSNLIRAAELKTAWQLTRQHFPPVLDVYHPGMFRVNGVFGDYPAISITGSECQLKCKHCNGRLLRYMHDGSTPEKFMTRCSNYIKQGKPGFLISGGADLQGQLPWKRYIPLIKALKSQSNLHISIHTGLSQPDTIFALAHAGVDNFMFDLVTSKTVYQSVFKQEDGLERLGDMIEAMIEARCQVTPHVILGLESNRNLDLDKTVALLKKLRVSTVVMLQFMPLSRTEMARHPTVDTDLLVGFIAGIRQALPLCCINLGCARKRPDSKLEILAVRAGVNRIALPELETLKFAESAGLKVMKHKLCCSVNHH